MVRGLRLSRPVQAWDGWPKRVIQQRVISWQVEIMNSGISHRLDRKLVDSLYVEAMLLADEARSYFEMNGRAEREALPPLERVGFSCESLRVTTRLMHVIAWLLTRRAVASGEIGADLASAPERWLARSQGVDPELVAKLPEAARQIIVATADLHARVARLDAGMYLAPSPSPAKGLLRRLEIAF
jgi:regulator of CtrA degradation